MEESGPITGVTGAKAVLLFVLRFLAASLVLYIIYMFAGGIYTRIVSYGAKPLLAIFGHRLVMERALTITEEISLNPIVYLSLVIAVGGIPLRRKLPAALWGILILTAANIIVVFMIFLAAYENSEQLWTGTEFVNLTINFFLPLLLWFILLPIWRMIPAFKK